MKTGQQHLNAILKTAQMGQMGIRSVLDDAIRVPLRQALQTQLQEYNAIEQEALSIGKRRGWEMHNLNPVIRRMCDLMTHARLRGGNVDSRIAGMMIQGNTRGMITGLKDIHSAGRPDGAVQVLAEKLLATETANIRQMKIFL